MFWPLVLWLLLAVMNAAVYWVNYRAGLLASLFLTLYLVLWMGLYYYHRNKVLTELIKFSMVFSRVENIMLNKLVCPFGILDSAGNLIWMNQAMETLFQDKRKKNISVFFPEVTSQFLDGLRSFKTEEISARYNACDYQILMHRIDFDHIAMESDIIAKPNQYDSFAAVYLFDETNLNEALQTTENEKPVMGLIYLDNYEEALETVDEIRRSLLGALIDRKSNKYFSGPNCSTFL